MFERYTEKARRVIFFARYEAGIASSQYIETHHLLLGLVREAPELFPNTDTDTLRAEVEARFPPAERIEQTVDLPLSGDGRRALEYAARESAHRGHRSIEPGHLALGLLAAGDETSEILKRHGINDEAVATTLEGAIAEDESQWDAIDEQLHSLPEDRLDAARRLLAALSEPVVSFRVTTPAREFTIAFGL